MPEPALRFFFDFVDPLSYLQELALLRAEEALEARIERVGLELRPPPAPLTTQDDPLWRGRWEAAAAVGRGVVGRLAPPRLVPWTRKAHELHLFARDRGRGGAVRRALLTAHFEEGRDIGRVDVLVDLAAALDLDRGEAKAALDVDRYRDEIVEARAAAAALGVEDVPTLVVDGRAFQGFRNHGELSTLLGGP